MEFRTHTLPNGLEIVAECNAAAYSAALGFFVKTGARDENDSIAGVSHFLEHMVFKGTPTRSADDVNREFDEMGADYNAFTNEENTVFYAAVLPEHVDRAMTLLADILRPSLREDDFHTEKQVILEEIQMYEDQPPFGADDKCRAPFYGSHPLGRSVLGTAESVGGLPVEAMLDYFRQRYSPGNIVLAGAGRIDFEAFTTAAVPVRRLDARHDAPRCDARRSAIRIPSFAKDTAAQQYVLQMAGGPTAEDEDRYAAKLLATVLGDDSGSRLYWELVDPGLAEHAGLSHGEHEGAGILMTYLCCDPPRAAENLRRLTNVYRRAEADGITEDELSQAKSKVRSRIVFVRRTASRPRVRRRQRSDLSPAVSFDRGRFDRRVLACNIRSGRGSAEASAHAAHNGRNRAVDGTAAAVNASCRFVSNRLVLSASRRPISRSVTQCDPLAQDAGEKQRIADQIPPGLFSRLLDQSPRPFVPEFAEPSRRGERCPPKNRTIRQRPCKPARRAARDFRQSIAPGSDCPCRPEPRRGVPR